MTGLMGHLLRRAGFWTGTGYFVAIGSGFMLVEAPWIQRFILYLGHPSHATTIVLAALLVGAGLGSLAAARVSPGKLRAWAPVLPCAVALANFGLATLFDATQGQALAVRAALSAAWIAPIGFLMGFPFPVGMIVLGDENKAWFWAVNGASGVLASVLSLAASMGIGLTGSVHLGVAAYLVACLLLLWAPARADR